MIDRFMKINEMEHTVLMTFRLVFYSFGVGQGCNNLLVNRGGLEDATDIFLVLILKWIGAGH